VQFFFFFHFIFQVYLLVNLNQKCLCSCLLVDWVFDIFFAISVVLIKFYDAGREMKTIGKFGLEKNGRWTLTFWNKRISTEFFSRWQNQLQYSTKRARKFDWNQHYLVAQTRFGELLDSRFKHLLVVKLINLEFFDYFTLFFGFSKNLHQFFFICEFFFFLCNFIERLQKTQIRVVGIKFTHELISSKAVSLIVICTN
jgi:hypothetical protein